MRVLIADDKDFIRRGVRAVLSEISDIQVCAEAVDGRDAVAKSVKFQPDVVIMDVVMPRLDGIDAIRLLHRIMPNVKILSLSHFDIPEVIDEIEKAGASAFLSKVLIGDKLVSSLRRVHNGEKFFGKNPD
jgi:DNA-binding NarL/FixJ family response regulator